MPNRNKKANRRVGKSNALVGFSKPVRSLFPDRFTGMMTYGVSFNFSPAATSIQTTVLRLNSVYDPDFSGTGTSAAGYTQASALYGRYRVIKADVELSAFASAYAQQFYAVASNDNTLGTSYATILAQRHVFNKQITPSVGVKTTMSIPIEKVYGVPRAQLLAEDDYAAIVGGNPSNQVFLHVGFYNPTSSASSAMVSVRIIYHVIWSLPVALTQV